MNEELKLSARRAMCGKKRRLAVYTFLLGITLLVFSSLGIGTGRLIGSRAFRSFLSSLHPALPDALGIVLCLVSLAAFTAVFSALSQLGFSRFCDEALNKSSDHARWFRRPFIFEAIKMNCLLFVIKCALLLFWFAVPAAVTAAAAAALSGRAVPGTVLPAVLCCLALALTALFFYILSTGSLVCAPYILAASPGMSGVGAIRESISKTGGALGGILRFRLSFLPWFLLCIAGFPVFFVLPYYRQSMAYFIFTE